MNPRYFVIHTVVISLIAAAFAVKEKMHNLSQPF